MTGKTHRLIGVTSALGALLVFGDTANTNPATLVGVLVVAHFGSLWPDIDNTASDIYDSLPFVKHVRGLTSKVVFGHRNFTHSLAGLAGFGLLFNYLFQFFSPSWGLNTEWLLAAFIIGYVTHLLADMVTVEGLPLLWPWQAHFGFPPKPFDGIRIQSGEWFENIVIFPLTNLVLIIVLWAGWPLIHQILYR